MPFLYGDSHEMNSWRFNVFLAAFSITSTLTCQLLWCCAKIVQPVCYLTCAAAPFVLNELKCKRDDGMYSIAQSVHNHNHTCIADFMRSHWKLHNKYPHTYAIMRFICWLLSERLHIQCNLILIPSRCMWHIHSHELYEYLTGIVSCFYFTFFSLAFVCGLLFCSFRNYCAQFFLMLKHIYGILHWHFRLAINKRCFFQIGREFCSLRSVQNRSSKIHISENPNK